MIDLDRFWAGDPAYMRNLFEVHSTWLLPVVVKLVGDEDEAQDGMQKIWINAFNNRMSYRGRGKFEAWVHRIALNECKQFSRRRTARDAALRDLAERGVMDDFSWTPPDPLDEVVWAEECANARAILESLAPREREAVNLRIIEGIPGRKVAEIMGITMATVRSLVRKGIHRIRNQMKGSRK